MNSADAVIDNIDHALHDWDVSGDAMRWTPEPAPAVADYKRMRIGFQVIGQHIQTQMRALNKAMQHVGKAYTQVAHRLMAHDRVRCRVCRPYSNPKPLAFGAEYHRRQQRRKRPTKPRRTAVQA